MIAFYIFLSLTVNDKAIEFTIEDINGDEFKLDSLYGKGLVVIDFWAVVCKPCIRQLETADEIVEKYAEHMYYLAINEDNPIFQKRAKNFIKARDFKFIVLLDEDGKIMREYGVDVLPTTFFLDDSLRILEIHKGFTVDDEKWFEETLEKYVSSIQKGDAKGIKEE